MGKVLVNGLNGSSDKTSGQRLRHTEAGLVVDELAEPPLGKDDGRGARSKGLSNSQPIGLIGRKKNEKAGLVEKGTLGRLGEERKPSDMGGEV